jgi:hypothetical protein
LGIRECQLVVLLKDTFMTTKEPLANGHLGFGFALAGGERVVVQGQRRVEITLQLAKFVCGTHLDLGLGESMIGGFFDVDTGNVEIGSEVRFGDADLRELPSQQHTVDLLYDLIRIHQKRPSVGLGHLHRHPAARSGRMIARPI